MENGTGFNIAVCIIVIIITQVVLKTIGINKNTVIIYDTLLVVIAVMYSIVIGKNGDRNKNIKMNFTQRIVSSILLSITVIFMVITLTFTECYPVQAHRYHLLIRILGIVTLLSFCILALYIIIIAYKVNMKNK